MVEGDRWQSKDDRNIYYISFNRNSVSFCTFVMLKGDEYYTINGDGEVQRAT